MTSRQATRVEKRHVPKMYEEHAVAAGQSQHRTSGAHNYGLFRIDLNWFIYMTERISIQGATELWQATTTLTS